jgi:hypothetical protein
MNSLLVNNKRNKFINKIVKRLFKNYFTIPSIFIEEIRKNL